MKFWSTIEASFTAPTRARVILLYPSTADLCVCRGSAIQLRRPNGTIVDTQITGIEMVKGVDKSQLGICLPVEFKKEDVPEGTEVWLVDQSAT